MTNLKDEIMIFSGSAHPELAASIAHELGIEVTDTTIKKFSNDNIEIQLGSSVRAKHVFLVQPLIPPTSDHLLELLIMIDIAKMSGAKEVHAVIPYFSYGRSDKKDAPRISITARLVANLLEAAGVQHIIGMTFHSPQIHGFFNVPTDHLTAHSAFVDYFRQRDLSDTVIVSPDLGNAKRAAKLADSLGATLGVGQKQRVSDEKVAISDILGNVSGKKVIIFDDEIATAGTVTELTQQLLNLGVQSISIATTHGLFSGSAKERLDALEIDEIITTNTVFVEESRKPKNLVVLNVGEIFGEVIARNVRGESIGALFEYWQEQ